MCFSAPASFIASGLLAAIGAIALAKIKNKNQRMFNSIPIIFSVQQACEGIVWLTYSYKSLLPLREFATYGFLFFAFILWPIWIPTAIYLMENNPTKKQFLTLPISMGSITAFALAMGILNYGVHTTLYDCNIFYVTGMPQPYTYICTLLYLGATIVPFFISSKRLIKLFGTLLALSYIISYVFYYQTIVSVWCFFVAALSILVLFMV